MLNRTQVKDKLTIRNIFKEKGLYYVKELVESNKIQSWVKTSKGYSHSTSAFAAMGRQYKAELEGNIITNPIKLTINKKV